jgi:hypothetical protein
MSYSLGNCRSERRRDGFEVGGNPTPKPEEGNHPESQQGLSERLNVDLQSPHINNLALKIFPSYTNMLNKGVRKALIDGDMPFHIPCA